MRSDAHKHIGWLPIRSLTPRHRRRIAAHLRALAAPDRYLRFGYAARDEQIDRYVESIDFEHDDVFGVFDRRLDLIAVAHLAFERRPPAADTLSSAEFGVSVLPGSRGRGFGARLFDHAMLRARNRGVDTLLIHALSENRAMLHIARKAGASVEQHSGEAQARLKLPPDTLRSHLDEAIENTAAEVDFQLKAQARLIDNWLKAIDEVSTHIKSSAGHFRE